MRDATVYGKFPSNQALSARGLNSKLQTRFEIADAIDGGNPKAMDEAESRSHPAGKRLDGMVESLKSANH